ncbi:hypothetical protein Hanom_Chr07g00644881 [Helianthus anomalus]
MAETNPDTLFKVGAHLETIYVDHMGENFLAEQCKYAPKKVSWFKPARTTPIMFHQNLAVEKDKESNKIRSWFYDSLKGMFVVKRYEGEIQYFTRNHANMRLQEVAKDGHHK